MAIFPSKLMVTYLWLIIIYLGFAKTSPIKVENGGITEFIILHNNDMHARFEQTSANSEKCSEELSKANQCYGGFARVAHEYV